MATEVSATFDRSSTSLIVLDFPYNTDPPIFASDSISYELNDPEEGQEVTTESEIVVVDAGTGEHVTYELMQEGVVPRFELSEYPDGSQKITYIGGITESKVETLTLVVSLLKHIINCGPIMKNVFPQATENSFYPIRSSSCSVVVDVFVTPPVTRPTFTSPLFSQTIDADISDPVADCVVPTIEAEGNADDFSITSVEPEEFGNQYFSIIAATGSRVELVKVMYVVGNMIECFRLDNVLAVHRRGSRQRSRAGSDLGPGKQHCYGRGRPGKQAFNSV